MEMLTFDSQGGKPSSSPYPDRVASRLQAYPSPPSFERSRCVQVEAAAAALPDALGAHRLRFFDDAPPQRRRTNRAASEGENLADRREKGSGGLLLREQDDDGRLQSLDDFGSVNERESLREEVGRGGDEGRREG